MQLPNSVVNVSSDCWKQGFDNVRMKVIVSATAVVGNKAVRWPVELICFPAVVSQFVGLRNGVNFPHSAVLLARRVARAHLWRERAPTNRW